MLGWAICINAFVTQDQGTEKHDSVGTKVTGALWYKRLELT